MARTKELSFTAERKFGDTKFGSIGYAMSETIILEEGDDREKQRRLLMKRVGTQAAEMNATIKSAIDEIVAETKASLRKG